MSLSQLLSQLPPAIVENAGNNRTLEILIGKAFAEAEETCTAPYVLSFANKIPNIGISFHDLIKILSGVACVFNCACCIYLITGHILCWVKPAEQRQFVLLFSLRSLPILTTSRIIRIILFNVVFSIASFFGIFFYAASDYIHPLAVCYEGLAMTALFLLYVNLVCPDELDRAQYFTSLERKWINGKVKKGSSGSLRWFRMIWILVFQVTFTRILCTIAQEVLFSNTCPLSELRAHVSIAIQVIQGISTGIAVYAIIIFERRMHSRLESHGHRPALKLVSFKLVVGLEAAQDILFAALGQSGAYFPTAPYRVSWVDFSTGIPLLILVFEMTIVSVAFMWAYSFEEYRRMVLRGDKVLVPSWRAFFGAFVSADLWRGVGYMFTCFTNSTYHEGHVDGRVVEIMPSVDRKIVDCDEERRL